MKESQNTEWKRSWHDKHLEWVCAFANAQGGTLIIGKNDDGSVHGVERPKKLLEDIPNKIRNHLGLTADVNLHETPEGGFPRNTHSATLGPRLLSGALLLPDRQHKNRAIGCQPQ